MDIQTILDQWKYRKNLSEEATVWLIKEHVDLGNVNVALQKVARGRQQEVERLKGELDHALLKLEALEEACGLLKEEGSDASSRSSSSEQRSG